ncbi:GDP-6-deoxy-D-mannose reductase [Legionella massiliensis]|uniref:GDP-6-deoxy-D-mannose reductase n=1 Tax=Legionella massiliensis TaxID=1034943 RepID=A0A078L0P5_9GAMM|nr:SDR family oxidoreductase [Legionella massiliensis]CDZ78817.1 GDP-6-deoxy-D-mannose reductase [Legionella massiliensis]CEE14555.1 GDP-6-deoxy-D-mannose reductase [Legionella massiliensis]
MEQANKRILLTGATGFVGQQLVKTLIEQNEFSLRIAIRAKSEFPSDGKISVFKAMELSATTNWQDALAGCDVVIHTAARAHIMEDRAKDPLREFRKVNTEGTLNLARQAASSGVKRFIFISSIKVNGESTSANQPFSADDLPNPTDPYAISKYEAEQGLQLIATKTGMDVVIIRPPLVYGPGVKGNFQRMLSGLKKKRPLPLGAIRNQRSFVSVDNLNSLIITCINHPRATNQVFLVSDDQDLSTTELLKQLSTALNRPVYLLPIPQIFLRWAAISLGKKAVFDRLCGSLQLNIDKTKEMLDWKPVQTVEEGFCRILSD